MYIIYPRLVILVHSGTRWGVQTRFWKILALPFHGLLKEGCTLRPHLRKKILPLVSAYLKDFGQNFFSRYGRDVHPSFNRTEYITGKARSIEVFSWIRADWIDPPVPKILLCSYLNFASVENVLCSGVVTTERRLLWRLWHREIGPRGLIGGHIVGGSSRTAVARAVAHMAAPLLHHLCLILGHLWLGKDVRKLEKRYLIFEVLEISCILLEFVLLRSTKRMIFDTVYE